MPTVVPVRARIRSIGNYSAHADHSELMAWIKERLPAHGAIFLTHGEDEERAALRTALQDTGIAGDQVILPLLDDAFELRAGGVGAGAGAAHAPHRPQPDEFRLAQCLCRASSSISATACNRPPPTQSASR